MRQREDFGKQRPNVVDRDSLVRWLQPLEKTATYIFLVSSFVSIAVNSLSMGLMSATLAGRAIAERKWPFTRTPLDLYFLGFILVQAASTIFSSDPLQSLILSKRVLLVGLVYFFASTATSEAGSKRLVAVLLGSAVVVACIGVLKLVIGGPGENTRLGIFQFYMTTSEVLTIVTLLMFPFAIHPMTPRRTRWLAILALVPVLISLWSTVTRGAYIAVCCGLLFVAIIRNKRVIIPLVLGIIVLVLLAPPYIMNRVESIIDVHHPENVGRIELWKTGIRIFLDHPLVGVGDIDTGHLIDRYADPSLPRVWGHLHNTPLQILVNYGAIGFVVILGMFVKIFRVGWKIFTLARDEWFSGSFALGSLGVLVAFFVCGLTEWTFGDQEVVTLIWATVGILLGIARLDARVASSVGLKQL